MTEIPQLRRVALLTGRPVAALEALTGSLTADGFAVEAAPAAASGAGPESAAALGEACASVLTRHGRLDLVVDVVPEVSGAAARARVVTAALEPGGRMVIVGALEPDHLDGGWGNDAQLAGLSAGVAALADTHRDRGIRVNVVAVQPGGPAEPAWGEVADITGLLAGAGGELLSGQLLLLDPSLRRSSTQPVTGTDQVPGRLTVTEAPVTPVDGAIVVVGAGLALPGASSPDEFWELLRAGRPVFGEPGERLDLNTLWSADPQTPDHTYSRVSGFMYGFRPHPRLPETSADDRESGAGELTARWLRHSVLHVLDQIRTRPDDRYLFAVGLTPDGSEHLEQTLVAGEARRLLSSSGAAPAEVERLLRQAYPYAVDEPDRVLPYRIARSAATDLPPDTEIVTVDTACSSSLYTIDLGMRMLRAGEVDIALCGGAFAVGAQNLVLFSKLHGLSRSGAVRSLDRGADGVLFSDGAAVVALKTHARALADGDEILGFVTGFGGSSDGRGKAVYAPNPAGQRLALQRAWAAAGVSPRDVDWIVAHATGTPTGDRVELTVLAELAEPGVRWPVRSNKSVVGHLGWAAGTVSVVHALLALQHGTIPGQPAFDALPAGLDDEVLHVASEDVPWPARTERPRHVGVSAMGFGGTNGHLLLSDAPAPLRPPTTGEETRPGADERAVVVTAWRAHLPGDPDLATVERWLDGGPPEWPADFGAAHALPSPIQVRLAPSALAAMDRGQLMALCCASELADETWVGNRELADRAGVFVGHTGPTEAALRHDLRCYLEDLVEKVAVPAGADPEPLQAAVRAAVPPATEDSYPGLMPNILAARVVQRLDLHGPNMTLDAGPDSFAAAVAAAVRYLRDAEIDVAVVLGVGTAIDRGPRADGEAAEAAIAVVLTRPEVARKHDLPVLAELDALPAAAPELARLASVDLPGGRSYQGAQQAVALLHTLRRSSRSGETLLVAGASDGHTPALVLRAVGATGTASLADVAERHELTLLPVPPLKIREATPAIGPGTLIVTDAPAEVLAAGIDETCLLVATPAAGMPGDGRVLRPADAADLAGLLDARSASFRRVCVVVSDVVAPGVLELNDLAFAAAQYAAESLDAGGDFIVVVLDAFDAALPRPEVGLFGGLVRSLEQELTGCRTLLLATDAPQVAHGLDELTAESAHHRYLPMTYVRDGVRYELMLRRVAEPAPDTDRRLPDRPVIVATGGARGVTAQLVEQLVTGTSPQSLWLLGTGATPEPVAAGLPPREQALRELITQHPGESLAVLNKRYERLVQDQERTATLRRLESLVGPDRVHYRQCDVRDVESVRDTMAEVLTAEGSVDIVVHGAGLVRSAALSRKQLPDYRTVRDVKVLGYRNLRSALAGHPPALWLSISSVGAFIGMRGESDYDAANEFLLLAAACARQAGRDEAALLSGLWVESGMAAGYVVGESFSTGLADFTQLTDRQGAELFDAEVRGRGGASLGNAWLGDAEWRILERRAPGFRDASHSLTESGGPRGIFLLPEQRTDTGAQTWDVSVDPARHPWLRHHLVDGRPTVPATFLVELAAEAAVRIGAGAVVSRITDVELSRFVRAPADRWPRPLRVAAERVVGAVRVVISTPAQGPVPAREHARMLVHFADVLGAGPRYPLPQGGRPVPDIYCLPGGSLVLDGPFTALQDLVLDPSGGSGRFRPGRASEDDGMLVPAVTLDCLLRTSVLTGADSGTLALLVPTRIAEIRLYVTGGDTALSQTWGDSVLLLHRPDAGSRDGESAVCAALAPDGTALLEVRGVRGSWREHYDLRTGRWRSGARAVVG